MRMAFRSIARRATLFSTKAAAVAVLAAGITVTTTSSSPAFNPVQAQHFVDCLGWLLSDPDMHAANCLPSRVAPSFGSLSTPGTPYTPPPPVETTEPDPCDEYEDSYWYWCECLRHEKNGDA